MNDSCRRIQVIYPDNYRLDSLFTKSLEAFLRECLFGFIPLNFLTEFKNSLKMMILIKKHQYQLLKLTALRNFVSVKLDT